MVSRKEFQLDGKTITMETGRMARSANGAVVVRCGDTMVLVTAVASRVPKEHLDFFPLTVDVEEKMYAAGKIPGGFIKREGRPSEKSTLTARLIDRPLRPSFPKGYQHEVQVIATTLSVDLENPQDVLALLGASAALTISEIPFMGPIGAVRMGHTDREWIVNPTYQELEGSVVDLVVAGTDEAILMVEAGADQVPEELMLEGLMRAHDAIKEEVNVQREFLAEVGTPKREFTPILPDERIEEKVRAYATDKLREALRMVDPDARDEALAAISDETMEYVADLLEEGQERDVGKIIKQIKKEEVRGRILKENMRADGRNCDEIRPITCEVGVTPRTHGSGLFTRGQTQVLSIVTLGTVSETQTIDDISLQEYKRYMHHYNFPPFCVGETGFMRGPRRRDIGHGALAERALLPVMPEETGFPYAIRVVSEILESNGSSSMASVCGSTLGLMDAGVPITAPVVGVAMGLVKEGDDVAVLTDILGMEDAVGDMDFKIAGTEKGITALQMDMKIAGVAGDVLGTALQKAREARMFILGKILEAIDKPREELSQYAPRIITIKIPTDKIRDVIGSGGKMIHSIIDETGATIDIEDDGTVFIASKDQAGGDRAKEIIEMLTKEIVVGERFTGKVTRLMNFGAFVEIMPGRDGLVHISRLSKERVNSVEDVVKEGDELEVEVIEIDRQNRINLSTIEALGKSVPPRRDEGRPPRRHDR